METDRRHFAAASLAAAAAILVLPRAASGLATAGTPRPRYCAFIKYLTTMSYGDVARAMAAAGFDGVEVNLRAKDGFIKPDQVAQELPKFHRTLAREGVEITILTTDIVSAEQPHAETALRVAKDLGVARYRMGFQRYNLEKPVLEQLAAWRPLFDGLAELNQRLGITGMYQNHCGANRMGATIWDLHGLIKDFPPSVLGCAWDLRHAAAEAGEAWPLLFQLMRPHLAAITVKDFVWKDRVSEHVALGQGTIDPTFYQRLAQSEYDGPLSVHVEHLTAAGAAANLAALQQDLATLKSWMSG